MTEWTELKTGKEVFDRQAEGWEIAWLDDWDRWIPWDGENWSFDIKYRGRPAQPKTRTVTSECWRCKSDGQLLWRSADKANCFNWDAHWQRFPAGDITGEVCDD